MTTTLGPLADGVHDLKLEVEDRAGNISHDYLLKVLIDTVAPTGTVNLFTDSDTGIWGFPETMHDRVTGDMTPLLYGAAEANALVRVALDIDENPPDGIPDGTAVAIPLRWRRRLPAAAGIRRQLLPADDPHALTDGEHTLDGLLPGRGRQRNRRRRCADADHLRRYGRPEDHERHPRRREHRQRAFVRRRDAASSSPSPATTAPIRWCTAS